MPPSEHRSDLIRLHTPAHELRVAQNGLRTTFSGYAAVFNTPTVINSWEGHFTEQIMPGAFRKTLQENGDTVRFLYDHGMDPSIGNKPLGKIDTLREDKRGLLVEATMLDRPYVDDITEALRAEALDGMSFRFSVVRDEWDESGPVPARTIKEAKLHEVSVVTFPAYQATTAGVRGAEAFRVWRNATSNASTDTIETDPPAADSGTGTSDAADTGTSGILTAVDRAELLEFVRRTQSHIKGDTHG